MRPKGNGDFPVDVEGTGRFVFGRRSLRDIYAIRGEYTAATSANFDEEGNSADIGALAFVTLNHLMVSAPAGWDINDLDPLVDEDAEEKVLKVFFALREKELSFRKKPETSVQAEGQGAGGESGGLVSGEVQSPADGSAPT